MSFSNNAEKGRPVTILDEGVALTNNVSSIDMVGAGVTATNLGTSVTASIPANLVGPASITAGSVLFGGPGNTVAQDNANFFWDDTNNYLGIGTTPSFALHVVGAGSSGLMRLQSTSVSGYSSFDLADSSGNLKGGFGYGNASASSTYSSKTYIASIGSTPLVFITNSSERARITSTGFLGIGTDTPLSLLHVSSVAASSGAAKDFIISGASHTNQSASTEITNFTYGPYTRTWNTGSFTTQREIVFNAPTYAFNGASTITNAATLSITGAPIAGTNATITNSLAFSVESGISKFLSGVLIGSRYVAPANARLRLQESDGTGAAAVIEFGNGTHSMYWFLEGASTGGRGQIRTDSTRAIVLQDNASSGQGFVGVGTPNPTAKLHVLTAAGTTGTVKALIVAGASHTGQTASTEINNVAFNTYTRTWATGAITTQRENVFFAPTYAFASASTITTAATVAISGSPIAGSNATLTRSFALWVQGGNTAFTGNNVYIGTQAPTTPAKFIVQGDGGDVFSCDSNAGSRLFTLADSGAVTFSSTIRLNGASVINGSSGDGYIYSLTAGTAWTAFANATDRKGFVVAGPSTGTMAQNYFEVRQRWNSTGTEYLVVNSSGYTGIGKTTPVAFLDVSGYAAASGTVKSISVNPAAHTGQTASTEINNFVYNTYTRTWATGDITSQREIAFNAPTYAFAGASTVSIAALLYLQGAPLQGTNATISNATALLIGDPTTAIKSAITGSVVGAVIVPQGIANGTTTVTARYGLMVTGANGQVDLGNQTATLSDFHGIKIEAINLISTTNTRTVTTATSLYIEGAPASGGNVSFTNGPYALFVDAGLARFDGNGTRVFELPADATGNTSAATGRVPILVGGSTKYLRYYND